MGATVRSLKRNVSTGNLFAENDAPLEVLAIGGAGGGAGSGSIYGGSGGGGAGGVIIETFNFPVGTFTVTVGAGGTGGASSGTYRGSSATDTTITGSKIAITAWAGGRGGPGGTDGGEFGGSSGGMSQLRPNAFGITGGAVLGQGQGLFATRFEMGNAGGGGGGATSPGGHPWANSGTGGFGGNGIGQLTSWAVATSTGFANGSPTRYYYAGGGGAGHSVYYGAPYNQDNAGCGGAGYGSGNSQNGTVLNAGTAGAANTGSGGGGGGANGTTYTAGYAGGSGIVIIRYPAGLITATGGTIVTSSGYTYHTFTSSGSFVRSA
jgi:hypothetical protein